MHHIRYYGCSRFPASTHTLFLAPPSPHYRMWGWWDFHWGVQRDTVREKRGTLNNKLKLHFTIKLFQHSYTYCLTDLYPTISLSFVFQISAWAAWFYCCFSQGLCAARFLGKLLPLLKTKCLQSTWPEIKQLLHLSQSRVPHFQPS